MKTWNFNICIGVSIFVLYFIRVDKYCCDNVRFNF